MKAVLISIKPKWCEEIARGKKTIEVRKSRPKLETPFKCLIYCTNDKRRYLRKLGTSCREIFITESKDILGRTDKVKSIIGDTTTFWEKGGYNGKVIGEFVCDRIDEYDYDQAFDESMGCFIDKYGYDITSQELEQTCLSYEELEKYGNTDRLYGWHITDLKIYDKPKELGEFEFPKDNIYLSYRKRNQYFKGITRPPQSWCYVEELQE